MDCEEAQVLMGMGERGALEPGREADLQAHLAGCAGCRAFAVASEQLTRELRGRGAATGGPRDDEEVSRVLRRHRRAQRLELLRVVGALLALAALVRHLEHPTGADWLVDALGLAVGGGLVILGGVVPRHRRAMAALAQVSGREELLSQLGHQLQRRIQERTWTDAMAVVALPAALALEALRSRWGPTAGHHLSTGWLVLLGACGVYGLLDLLIGVPRLKRERAGLE